MEDFSKDLIAVEELFIAVEISGTDKIVVIQADAILDLSEFNLTPQKTEKFQNILMKLNGKLADSFQKLFPACSVISEIRSQSKESK